MTKQEFIQYTENLKPTKILIKKIDWNFFSDILKDACIYK